jgi:hypothetical protein
MLSVIEPFDHEEHTGGDVEESELELRAELSQVFGNIYIELRWWWVRFRVVVLGRFEWRVAPFEQLRDPGSWGM